MKKLKVSTTYTYDIRDGYPVTPLDGYDTYSLEGYIGDGVAGNTDDFFTQEVICEDDTAALIQNDSQVDVISISDTQWG